VVLTALLPNKNISNVEYQINEISQLKFVHSLKVFEQLLHRTHH